jgi:disulfide bond formation protein DsbB
MSWMIIFCAWIISAVATLGSLFFSEVMMLPPCILCWYQRIAMYPLSILLFVGLLKIDRSLFRFTAPLALIGWAIAVYHNLLYYKILPESASPCVKGISCTTVQLEWLGFITIPLLSLIGFTLILLCLIFFRKNYEN